MKGGSEWDTMARYLTRLAAAYQTTFPLPTDASARRMNDAEVAGFAEQVAKQSDLLKKQIDHEQTIAKPAREAAKKDVDAVTKQAKALKSRLSDGQPATAEARTLRDLTSKVGTFVGAQSALLPDTTGAWKALRRRSRNWKQGVRAEILARRGAPHMADGSEADADVAGRCHR
jgi:hypothetical protein